MIVWEKTDTTSQTDTPCCSTSPSPPYCQPQTGKHQIDSTRGYGCNDQIGREKHESVLEISLFVAADSSQSASMLSAEDELAELLSCSTLPNQPFPTTRQDWAESRPPGSTGQVSRWSSLGVEQLPRIPHCLSPPKKGSKSSPELAASKSQTAVPPLLSPQSWITQRQM